MQRVTKVGVLSLAKVMGAVGVVLGVIFGGIYGVILAIAGAIGMSNQGGDEAGVFLLMALGTCLGAPIMYGLMSFLMGLLYAAVMNFVFKYTGGLELKIESD
jgi:hypothetical protein